MGLIATEARRFSNVVKNEYSPETGYCRDVLVVNDAAIALVPGMVLGQVTATGKYKICKATATDGSEVAAAVVLEEKALPATTDTGVLALVRSPSDVSKGGLILDATIDTDGEKAAVYAALEAKGIRVLNAI